MSTRLAITPAVLSWSDAGYPASLYYDDIYFNNENGLEESKYVFLQHNHLTERFFSPDTAKLTLAETGFGTGLNFLLTLQAFRDAKAKNAPIQHLHFISMEKHPLSVDELQKALSRWPSLGEEASALIENYPKLTPGCHRCYFFEGQVTLDLWLGDVQTCLTDMHTSAVGIIDGWYLDGFAPSKNPDMWCTGVYQNMARLSRHNATLATFTAAGHVRRGLQSAGFTLEKVPGFGRKREMLRGFFQRERETATQTPEKISIIGGGIASAALAFSLTQRGYGVDVFCKDAQLAQGASGNVQGAIYPLLNADFDTLAQFSLSAYLYTRRVLPKIATQAPFNHAWCGVLQCAFDEKSQKKLDKISDESLFKDILTRLNKEQAHAHSGLDLKKGGVFYPEGGWVCPQELTCALFTLAEKTGLCTLHFQQEITQLDRTTNTWTLQTPHTTHDASTLVIACGHSANQFAVTEHLPIYPVRGQVSHVKPTEYTQNLKTVLCAQGYMMPALNEQHCIGASYVRRNTQTHLNNAEHSANKDRLTTSFPPCEWAQGLDFTQLNGRAAIRCATRDHLPFIGPVPDREALTATHANLFMLTALGSRGLCTALLSAEILAAQICHEPLPVPEHIRAALDPARMWLRKRARAAQKTTAAQ